MTLSTHGGMAKLSHERWVPVSRALCALVTVAGLAWGLTELVRPSMRAANTIPVPTVAATDPPESPSVEGLPRAWSTPTKVPTSPPTLTPTNTPTYIVRVRNTTARPSITASPTVTSSPTPTQTPIHAPAERDPTRITAPAIGLDTKVVTVGMKEQYVDGVLKRVWEVADYAAGFHKGMARPGQVGNTVISGHNNIRGEVFRYVHKLKAGDDVYVWVGNSPYRYLVGAVYRLPIKGAPRQVQQDNLRLILPTSDQRLTLVTCWPYWSNTHRIVVVAFPSPWDS